MTAARPRSVAATPDLLTLAELDAVAQRRELALGELRNTGSINHTLAEKILLDLWHLLGDCDQLRLRITTARMVLEGRATPVDTIEPTPGNRL